MTDDNTFGSTARLLLIVEEPRDAVDHAVALGATEVAPVGPDG
jgi:hypothetical protein